MAGMQFDPFDYRSPVTTTRALRPSDAWPALALKDELRRKWTIDEYAPRTGVSPLNLLLGATETSAASRMLALGVLVGLDWVGLRSSELGGVEVVRLVTGALKRRADDVDLLLAAANALTGNPVTVDDGQRIQGGLDRLLEKIHPVTMVLYRDTGNRRTAELDPNGLAFESDDPIALAAIELWRRTLDGIPLNRCELCGARFVPTRQDAVYCSRPAVGSPVEGTTCRQVGPGRRHAAEASDIERAYRREYRRLDMRQRRGAFSRAELDAWRAEARALLERAGHSRWKPDRLTNELRAIAPKED